MEIRCAAALNQALTRVFEQRADVYLIGEDILDPYGGAFAITKGLSTRWPDRVIATPVSEAALFGIAAGMAIRGYRPILEVMFGDFVTLGLDQIVNGIGKFREMFDDQVRIPLVVRTPMGGGRGYGPTHSQSLEKLLTAVPGITVVAANEAQDLEALVREVVDDDEPVFLIEHKQMYARANRRPVDGRYGDLACRETNERYPALTFSGNDFGRAEATIVTFGGMLPAALAAMLELILEEEHFTEVVALGQLSPLRTAPILDSVARTGALITVEEGTMTGGIGAEIAARVQDEGWTLLRAPVQRIAAPDGIIPAARSLERAVLPRADQIVARVLSLRKG